MDTENHAAGAETATGDNLDPLRKLLTETTLDYLKHMQHVTILKDTATVEQALKVHVHCNIRWCGSRPACLVRCYIAQCNAVHCPCCRH